MFNGSCNTLSLCSMIPILINYKRDQLYNMKCTFNISNNSIFYIQIASTSEILHKLFHGEHLEKEEIEIQPQGNVFGKHVNLFL